MKKLLSIVACCSCALFAQSYRIEGPAALKPHERTAIGELKDYLAKRIDGKLEIGGKSPVTFVVGDSELAKANGLLSTQLEDEQWVIKSFGDKVVINGGGTRGVLYGAYHFLEDFCDIHWWSDIEEYVPKAGSLSLPALDKKGKPVFIYRDIYRTDKMPNSSRTAVRNRLNRDGDQQIPAELGGAFNYGEPYHCHTFDKYVPASEYMETHPEYFSLVDGKRVGGFYQGQLCLSNPDLKPLFVRKLLKYIEESKAAAEKEGLPAPRLYDISMNDTRKFCTCEDCMKVVEKYGRSGEYLLFLNYIADEVAKVHPEILLTTLAYFNTEEPPKGGVRAAKNLVVKLCDTATSQAISIYTERNRGFREKVEAWKAAADNLFIWDYSIIYKKNMTGLPFPSEMYYGEQCRFYHENNVKGIFWEHEFPSMGDLYELKYFLECKMMEDPYQDDGALIRLFMDKYYGPAAEFAMQYRQLIYKAAKDKNANVPWFPKLAHFAYISDAQCVECEQILDKAEAAVKDDAQLFRRVRRLRSGIDRLICTRANSIIKHGPAFKNDFHLDGSAASRRLGESYVDWFTQYKGVPKIVEEAKKFVKGYTVARGKIAPPEQFKDRSYYEYGAFDFTREGQNMSLVEDPDSAVGWALMTVTDVKGDVRGNNYKLPFQFGYYDRVTPKTLAANKVDKLPEKRGYNWYKVGKFTIPEDGYIYVTGAWTTQIFTSIKELIGKEAEIWISVKHEGPLYYPEQKAPSRIYVDRAILLID